MSKLNIYRGSTLVLSILSLIFIVLFCRSCNNPVPSVEPIIIHDTVKVTEFVDKIKYVEHYDTAFVTNFDTIYNNDTLKFSDTIKLEIPIEYKESTFAIKKDSFEANGTVHYHGFKAAVDSVDIDYKFTYVPPIEKKHKWHISLNAGYYTGYNLIDRKLYSGPGAGIGISYDLW